MKNLFSLQTMLSVLLAMIAYDLFVSRIIKVNEYERD